jgi:hypothetical protein
LADLERRTIWRLPLARVAAAVVVSQSTAKFSETFAMTRIEHLSFTIGIATSHNATPPTPPGISVRTTAVPRNKSK